jgi:hypothetical protein
MKCPYCGKNVVGSRRAHLDNNYGCYLAHRTNMVAGLKKILGAARKAVEEENQIRVTIKKRGAKVS